ncbi:MAG TPA: hypothetical protein VN620_00635, partial [Candidatus Methylomirabilis sp.]|nr:hypothetical protein [Candidatus Methylomirabilis sp.]
MTRQSDRSLSHLLAIDMFIAALAVSIALIALTAAYYLIDKSELRRLTLQMQVRHIVEAIGRGDDPAKWELYRAHPKSYAFRVFDHRQAWQRKVISEANTDLLTSFATGNGADLVSGVTSNAAKDIDGDG